MRTRIILVDDHQLMRDGLQRLLCDEPDIEVVGSTGDPKETFVLTQNLHPDLVLLDIELPGIDGIQLTRELHKQFPKLKIAILSVHTEPERIKSALQAGVVGYLSKSNAYSELLKAIQVIVSGQIYLCSDATTVMTQEYRSLSNPDASNELKERERIILKLIAEGHSTKEIAATLQISTKTVEAQRSRIMQKTKATSIAALTKYALRHGLTSL
jgi:DNA-binding NarL/FixJ family response regulator